MNQAKAKMRSKFRAVKFLGECLDVRGIHHSFHRQRQASRISECSNGKAASRRGEEKER